MMNVAIYTISTGQVMRFCGVPEEYVLNQALEGEDIFLNCPREATHIVDGEPVIIEPEPVPLTPDQIQINMTWELEKHYDSVAQQKNYDNRLTCALRGGYTGPFQAEGQAFGIWMDTCNVYGYQVIADVQAETRVIPTVEVLISELPVMVWPS